MQILFLPRWYPNRYDSMPGLFIQRQAEALAGNHDIVVLYLHPDPDCPNGIEIDYAVEKEVQVVRIYFAIPSGGLAAITKPAQLFWYWRAMKRGLEVLQDYRPEIVHSHILTRMPLMGHYLARKWKVPHVISEHWSRYFPENNTYTGFVRKYLTRKIVHQCAALLPVSVRLQQAMHTHDLNAQYEVVVPNIVDLDVFTPGDRRYSHSLKQILHVSCFEDKSKNISGLLKAVQHLLGFRQDFRLLLAGEGPDWGRLQQEAGRMGLLGNTVHFTGLKTGQELVDLYRSADFSILSSRYETFGMVIPESLACGTPVVSTRVGIAPEVITSVNGLLAEDDHPETIAMTMNRMLNSLEQFDRVEIRQSVSSLFSPDAVADQLHTIYQYVATGH